MLPMCLDIRIRKSEFSSKNSISLIYEYLSHVVKRTCISIHVKGLRLKLLSNSTTQPEVRKVWGWLNISQG